MTASGGVAEWSIAPVLKTGNGQPFVSSNLTASAKPDKKSPATAGLFRWEGGIRTLDTVNRIPDFESGAFDHSATSPAFVSNRAF